MTRRKRSRVHRYMTFSEYETLGACYLERGEYLVAAEMFVEAAKINPKSWNTYNCLGAALEGMHEYSVALTALQKSIALSKEREAIPYSNAGCILLKLDQPEEALLYLLMAVKLQEDYSPAHAHIAEAYLKLGQLDLSEHHCKRTLDLNPRSQLALLILSLVKRQQNDFATSAQLLRKFLHQFTDPDLTEQVNALLLELSAQCIEEAQKLHDTGKAFLEQGEFHKAENAFREALKLNKNDPMICLDMAEAFQKQDRKCSEFRYLMRAVKWARYDDVLPLCRLAEYHRDNRPAVAQKLYTEVLNKSAENTEALVGMCGIYIAQGEYAQAESFLLRAAAKMPEQSQFYGLLASVFRSRSDSLASVKALQTALTLETHEEQIAALHELIRETRGQHESLERTSIDAFKLGNTRFGLRFIEDSGDDFLIA